MKRPNAAYAAAVGVVAIAAAISVAVVGRSDMADVVMVFTLGIVIVSLRFGRGPSLVAAALSVITYDYFFVPPYSSFYVTDPRRLVTFGVMFLVALVISSLMKRVRDHADTQLAAAVERAHLAEQAEARRAQVETEQLRSALLSSVSHDLRTPLAVITGAASTLLKEKHTLPEHEERELLQSVYDESDRLNRLIGNLLDMTRLEAGPVKVKKEWFPIDEIVGVAINRTEARLGDRDVHVSVEPDLSAPLDGLLVEQALVNLLENAAKYTPPRTTIDIFVRTEPGSLVIDVSDRGPGLPVGEEERIFEKFYRGQREGASGGGAGLGLAIARAIAKAHGGDLSARQREGGGAVFTLVLSIEGEPPAPPSRDAEPTSPLPTAKEPFS